MISNLGEECSSLCTPQTFRADSMTRECGSERTCNACMCKRMPSSRASSVSRRGWAGPNDEDNHSVNCVACTMLEHNGKTHDKIDQYT